MVGELAIQNRKSILELLDAVWDPKTQENNIFSCRATIQSILDLWSYSSCEKCSKKVEICGNKTWCTTCQMEVTAVPRYRLEMEVQDSTGTTSFVAFDREVENLVLAAPATAMSKIEQGDHPAKEFETLYLHHQLEFQIKLTEFNMKQQVKTFTAQKMFQIHNSEVKGAEMMNSEPNSQEMKDTDRISVEEMETKGKPVSTSDAESTELKNSRTYKHILSTIKTEEKSPECEGNPPK
ncbi:hypothetical protein C5167_010791 [Papaver somniferum]|uniref:Replication factor A C-terminal domain-containing protein n=1 Tax=Papaver somniferum TaxID=3469 RepID=A0A4Y7K4H1_PAPSO|nr:uncharacterized protein LOC113291499 [Papaver somniferum]RZC67111.1 hypothetical protein C5167_010791 [Papaver somniferum]